MKNKDRIKQLIILFFDRLPKKEKQAFSNRVFELFLEDLSITEIEINHLIGYDFLIIYGSMEDLSDKAAIGLISHLYALLQIDFESYPYPFNSETFYILDKKADALAGTWRFQKEIAELRKKRPQKLVEGIFYNTPILKQSIPNKLFFDKQSKFISEADNKAILYSHSFSTGVDFKKLESKTNSIRIITNKDLFNEKNRKTKT